MHAAENDDREPASRHFISQRLKLHYVEWGAPSAAPLILLHGGRDHCRNWDHVARALSDRYRVIVPDLRGHGDSQWSAEGHYSLTAYVYDLAQLVRQEALAPLPIVGHSLGGNIAVRFTGLYPEAVTRLVSIEGLGPTPEQSAAREAIPVDKRLRDWIDELHGLASRQPRLYATIDEAVTRMRETNARLSPEQARHLTIHGLARREDGRYAWKFDNYVRTWFPTDLSAREFAALCSRVACPTLLVNGSESWASDPAKDGRAAAFPNVRTLMFEGAGHWVQHDRPQAFLAALEEFLAG